jgi:uncharacterized protein (DUF427 family)
MMDAIWNNTILAKSDKTIIIEGNHYFPPNSIKKEFFKPNKDHTTCPWKGKASYYDIKVNGKINSGAAWYYPKPLSGAIQQVGKDFSNYIAFWRGIKVQEE